MRTRDMSSEPITPKVSSSASDQHTILSTDATVIGEIKGNSDVSISGQFEGTITIPSNTATVELSGSAQASINANRVVIHGSVKGNLYGSDTVHIMSTGVVEGDIKCANIILEKACKFNGSIQMLDESSSGSGSTRASSKDASAKSGSESRAAPSASAGSGSESNPAMSAAGMGSKQL